MKFKLIYTDGIYVGLLNGSPFISDSLTTEQVKVLTNNPTEEQVIEIFNPKIAEVAQHNREVKEIQDILVGSGLFELNQGSYFRVGIPYSVPKLLLEKYKEKIVNGFSTEALDNFWIKCCLNPNVYARENLFEYLQRWEFVITSKGYIVSYRNANVLQRGNKDLHDFIATQYTKIRGQKKAPKNYNVYVDDNSYVIVKADAQTHGYNSFVGNLQELYNNLPTLSDTIYTDAHSGTTRIRIGEVVSIPRSSCDESQQECSAGLHTASSAWLKRSYYGTEGLVCLVNPMDIVSVPKGDYGKMRSSSYLPIGVAEYDDTGKIIPVSTGEYEDDYDVYSTEQLNEILQNIDPSNQVIYKLEMKEISPAVFSSIDEYANQLEFKNEYCGYYDEEE